MDSCSFQCFWTDLDLLQPRKSSVEKKEQKKRGRKPSKGPSLFSKNLKSLMADRRLSSREIARICGVGASVVSQWLGGSNPSDSIAVLKLCQHFGLDFQQTLTGIPSQRSSNDRFTEFFDVESAAEFSGVFLIEAKRLKWKKGRT